MQPIFDREYKKLNPAQKEAVDSIEGSVMVVAGPGTGKTQILTLRIAHILSKTDTDPDSILALTFTEAGVQAMRKRLFEMIGPDAYRVGLFTFHGLANQIIQEHAEYFPMLFGVSEEGTDEQYRKPQPLTDVDQVTFLEEILAHHTGTVLKPFGDAFFYLSSIERAIGELKKEGLSPEQFTECVVRARTEFDAREDTHHIKGAHAGKMKGDAQKELRIIEKNAELADVYTAYQELLKVRRRYDFADMLIAVVVALRENQELKQDLQEHYQYVLVDEHQDTNNAQNALLTLLLDFHESPNLFVVGDPKQSVYRFAGASLENFYYFKHRYPFARLITLEENYRSHQGILDSALDLLKDPHKLVARTLAPAKPIEVVGFNNEVEELFGVLEMIKRNIADGIDPHEIAVLTRTNNEARLVSDMLRMGEVPHILESDNDVYDDASVKAVMIVLNALHRFGSDDALAPFLYHPLSSVDPLDAVKIVLYAKKLHGRNTPIADIIADPALLKKAGVSDIDTAPRVLDNLKRWFQLFHDRSFLEALDRVVDESGGLLHIMSRDDTEDALSHYRAWYESVRRYARENKPFSLEAFFKLRTREQQHGKTILERTRGGKSGYVRVMTAHRAKGLEFDYVYVPFVKDGGWGNRRSIEYLPLLNSVYQMIEDTEKESLSDAGLPSFDPHDKNGDDRRLFFVALTRARIHVCASYALIGNTGREQAPSVFLGEIEPALLSQREESDIHARYQKALPALLHASQLDMRKDIQSFVKDQFEAQALSVTALNNYLKSPWLYLFRNLLRIPEEPVPHLKFGNAVHGALEDLFNRLQKEEEPGKEFLLSQLDARLYASGLVEQDIQRYQDMGHDALGMWYDTYAANWVTRVATEVGVYDVSLGDVALSGKLDKIEFLPNEGVVNVVDYKTGKQKTEGEIRGTTKDSNGEYYRQLVFYKLLLRYHKGGLYTMKDAIIDFVIPDKDSKKLKRVSFSPTEQEVDDLEVLVQNVASEIRAGSIWNAPTDIPELAEYQTYIEALKKI